MLLRDSRYDDAFFFVALFFAGALVAAAGAAALASSDAGRFMRSRTKFSTTDGSASVEISPSWSCSFAAILRRIRRMIFPERVLGRLGAHCRRSGAAMAPSSLRTQLRSSLCDESFG